MKLGIGLPNTLAHEIDRSLFLSWARLADEAGFHNLGTIDKPNYDSWDPLTTLAAAAGVTERARLASTIVQLPNRNEVLVAKQAAVIDQVSGGRLDLGVAVGGREDDYEIFEAHFRGKGKRFGRQIERIREIWSDARSSDHDHGVLGPPPVQEPGPPIWVGGSSPPAVQRAIELGDGFIFGTPGPKRMADMTPTIREEAAKRGKTNYPVAGLAYVGGWGTTPPRPSRRRPIKSCGTTGGCGAIRRTSSTTARGRRSPRTWRSTRSRGSTC